MKNILALLCGIIFSYNQPVFSESSNHMDILKKNIGELVLSHNKKFSYENDKNPFGGDIVFSEFKGIYQKNIKKLDERYRVNFFWFAMWHLDFDGHAMLEFQKLIKKDCGNAFIEKLERYIKVESQLNRNKSRLFLSKKVFEGLRLLK